MHLKLSITKYYVNNMVERVDVYSMNTDKKNNEYCYALVNLQLTGAVLTSELALFPLIW